MVPCLLVRCLRGSQGRGACTVRSNALWVMVTWDSFPSWTNRHEWRHYLPTTSLSGGKYYVNIYAILTWWELYAMEFFLNVFTEFSEFSNKNLSLHQKDLNLLLSHILCKRPGCYRSVSKTHMRDRIFKSSLIHASVIITFFESAEFSENSAPFRKNSNRY